MSAEFKKEIVKLSGVLLIITFIVAALLGAVNFVAAPKIVEINKEKTQKAMKEIIADADTFEPVESYEDASGIIREVFKALKGGEYIGVCVKVAPQGFGGEVVSIVGISNEDTVYGSKIIASAETPGLGSKASEPDWISQYIGKGSPLTVVKNSASGANDIVAISGATITSVAVTSGVQAALDFAAQFNKEVQ